MQSVSAEDSLDTDTQINTDFLIQILEQYAKDHNALLVEEAGAKLGRALQLERDKISPLETEN